MITDKLLKIGLLSLVMLATLVASTFVVSAVDIQQVATIGSVTQFTAISLPQGGSNGTDSWSNCNITSVVNPNHVTILGNAPMTKIGSDFNYTLDQYNTSILGTYTVRTVCYDGYNVIPGGYTFEVTTTGKYDDLSFWISLIIVIFALVVLLLAYMFDSIYIAFMSGALFIISGVMIYLKGFGSIQDMYTNAIGIVLLGFGLIVTFASAFYHDGPQSMAEAFGIEREEKDPYDYFEGKDE